MLQKTYAPLISLGITSAIVVVVPMIQTQSVYASIAGDKLTQFITET